jgi:hypothetical protein
MQYKISAINVIIKTFSELLSFISILKNFYVQPLLCSALPGSQHLNLSRAARFCVRSGHETTLAYQSKDLPQLPINVLLKNNLYPRSFKRYGDQDRLVMDFMRLWPLLGDKTESDVFDR